MSRILRIPGEPSIELPNRASVNYFSELHRRAHEGDAEAQWELGANYESGDVFPRNQRLAVAWYEKAVKNNFIPASTSLAVAVLSGNGTTKDPSRAVDLLRSAAKTKDVAALARLGQCYLAGEGVARNRRRGISFLTEAARGGSSIAAELLAHTYANGVRADPKNAFHWWVQAMKLGSVEAVREIALAYEFGRGVRKNKKQAFRFMRRAADLGDPFAMHGLGWYYQNGYGISASDSDALHWYQRAADRGLPEAAFNAGIVNWSRGDRTSIKKAETWFQKAARLGHHRAALFLKTRNSTVLESR